MTALGAVLPLLLAAAGTPPRFSAGVEQVRLDVVVSRGGEPVSELTAADFEVLDNGVRQPIELVSREQRAVHGVLVLDLSSSLDAPQRQALQEAAATFLRKLEPGDRATLLTFTEDLQLVSGPDDPERILASLSALSDSGTTALYDAVYAGATLAGAAPGRPFVLVFTDGLDQISWLSPEKLAQVVRGLEATVYVVSPEAWPEIDKERRGPVEAVSAFEPGNYGIAMAQRSSRLGYGPPNSREIVARIVADSGGKVLSDRSRDGFSADFAAVLSEVKNRYLLVYDQQGTPRPGWHEIKVRLKKRKGDVRARRGYFAAP